MIDTNPIVLIPAIICLIIIIMGIIGACLNIHKINKHNKRDKKIFDIMEELYEKGWKLQDSDDPHEEVTGWLYDAMANQCFQMLDGPTDISKATSKMSDFIPAYMIQDIRSNNIITDDFIKNKWEELRKEYLPRLEEINKYE